jgi:uncharacterized protein (DUF1778 family)
VTGGSKKDPVKVAAGKQGGRPVTVDGRERLTIRVSAEWHAKLREAAERAKAEGRTDLPVGQIVRLALDLVLRDVDGRDVLKLLLEDPDQLELRVRPSRRRRSSADANAPKGARRGRRGGEAPTTA